MIKNIVFDMGKVLVGYDAMRVCEHYIKDPADREQVCTAIFVSPEWIMLDMGVLPEDMAMERICARLPERLHETAYLCMRDWHLYNMWPLPGMGELVKELKNRGFGIYLCSNASMRLPVCYQDVIPGIEYFDGILFSAEEKCMKPQKEIYQILFERFHLDPAECFFIDDQQLNIDGARACGMDGYCYADEDLGRLRERLEKLNYKKNNKE